MKTLFQLAMLLDCEELQALEVLEARSLWVFNVLAFACIQKG